MPLGSDANVQKKQACARDMPRVTCLLASKHTRFFFFSPAFETRRSCSLAILCCTSHQSAWHEAEILAAFAKRDAASVNASQVLAALASEAALCDCRNTTETPEPTGRRSTQSSFGQGAILSALKKGLEDGLFGQTLQQIQIVFAEMDLLVEQYASTGRKRLKKRFQS